jgi:rubrerythrin
MNYAYVITCNDSIEAVVLTDDGAQAEAVKDRLKAADEANRRRANGEHWRRHTPSMHWAARCTKIETPTLVADTWWCGDCGSVVAGPDAACPKCGPAKSMRIST